jgi:hypothetical protein
MVFSRLAAQVTWPLSHFHHKRRTDWHRYLRLHLGPFNGQPGMKSPGIIHPSFTATNSSQPEKAVLSSPFHLLAHSNIYIFPSTQLKATASGLHKVPVAAGPGPPPPVSPRLLPAGPLYNSFVCHTLRLYNQTTSYSISFSYNSSRLSIFTA